MPIIAKGAVLVTLEKKAIKQYLEVVAVKV